MEIHKNKTYGIAFNSNSNGEDILFLWWSQRCTKSL